jgi:hypothetical protein
MMRFKEFFQQYILESIDLDEEYLRLAQEPDDNVDELQKMVDVTAIESGFVEVFRAVRNNAPKLKVRDRYQLSFSTRKEVADSYGQKDEDTTRYFIDPSKAFPLEKEGIKYPEYNKFSFDRMVQEKGFVVARGMYDTGPYASLERDPKRLFSYKSDIYGLINPSKIIKSADPVTYDDEGNIIPLSKRFDKSKDDIRY